ncbi:MAG TPA: hypothetical protein VFV97_04085, partial [Rhodanobacteraceae bacterium]|nr:hypothetical protein [Rhodanobacteraceae bacterium]
ASTRIDDIAASNPIEAARRRSWLGETYLAMDDVSRARPALESAVDTLRTAPASQQYMLGHTLRLLARTLNRMGESTKALDVLAESETVLARTGVRTGGANADAIVRRELDELRANRGEILACLDRMTEARAEFTAALVSLRALRDTAAIVSTIEQRAGQVSETRPPWCAPDRERP